MATAAAEPDPPDAVLLLVGLKAAHVEAVLRALAGMPAVVHQEGTLRGGVDHMWREGASCIFLGEDAARGHWAAAAIELRRAAPAAALIGVVQGGAAAGADLDDVLDPSNLPAGLLRHMLRTVLALARAHRRLEGWALRDPLTDVLNRRGLERLLRRETSGQARGQGSLAALLIDCDDFKRINDGFGLETGDQTLQRMAEVLTAAVRGGDTVARVGGDEFLILLPQTRTWEAVEIAERVRAQVPAAIRLPDGSALSVSIGVRRLEKGITTVSEVLASTQAGLSLSKAMGKDRVHVVPGDVRPDEPTQASMPPGAPIPGFLSHVGHAAADGAEAFQLIRVDADAAAAEDLATQRAAQAAWDVHWFRMALRDALPGPLPVHARLYPPTLLEVPAQALLRALPGWMVPSQLVVAIDEQYLSGNPSRLRAPLAELAAEGVGVCVDVVEFSRSCLEAMVLLRPALVRSAAGLLVGIGATRGQRAAYGRFTDLCRALDVQVVASFDSRVTPADRAAAVELGAALHVELPRDG